MGRDPLVVSGRRGTPEEPERYRREALLRLHQLRVVLAFLQRQPLPELADPLGDGPLPVEVDGDTITVRSAAAEHVRRVVRPAR